MSRENQCPGSKTVRQREPFTVLGPSVDWLTLTHTWKDTLLLLRLQIQMLISPRNLDTRRKMFNQILRLPKGWPK